MKTVYKVGEWRTAKQMALMAHNLSKDGLTAYTPDGSKWGWSDYFNVWSCIKTSK